MLLAEHGEESRARLFVTANNTSWREKRFLFFKVDPNMVLEILTKAHRFPKYHAVASKEQDKYFRLQKSIIRVPIEQLLNPGWTFAFFELLLEPKTRETLQCTQLTVYHIGS